MSGHGRKVVVAAVAVAILAVVVYLPGLPGDFVYDDHRLIVDNDGFKRPLEPGRAFLRDYYASDLDRMGLGYYRPVTVLSKEFDYRRGGGRSLPFHLTNIAVHMAASLLVFAVALTLAGTGLAAAAGGAALFAVHAAHAESVAFISGRVDPLAALFVLAALALHLRANRSRAPAALRVGAGMAWLAALLSKEMAATGPALIFLVELSGEGWPRRGELWQRARRYLPYLCAFALYLPLRLVALGQLLAPSGATPPPSVVNPLLVLGSYLAWLVLPPPGLHLEPAPVGGPAAWTASALTIVVIAGVVALWRAGWRRESALIAAAVVALLPVAQFKPLETFLSERFLYLPSALIALLFAALLGRALARGRTVRVVAALLATTLGVAHLAILEPRVRVWRDEAALWLAKEEADGGSLKARLNLAHTYTRRGNHEEALRWYALTKEIAPHLAAGLDAEIGSLTGDLGSDATEAAIRKGLEAVPDDAALWNNLGFHLIRKKEPAEAASAFERSLELSPNRASAWLGLALARLTLREISPAEEAAAQAFALDPELGLARAILGECALRDGRPCEALKLCEGVSLEDPAEQATLQRIEAMAREACRGGAGADDGRR